MFRLNLNKFKVRIFIAILFILLIFFLQYIGVGRILTLSYIKEHKDALKYMVEQNYVMSVLIYLSFFILASFLSIPITIMLNLLAGFLFGALVGAIYVNIGTTTGAVLSFFTFRYLIGSFIKERYSDRLREFNNHIKKNGYSYLLAMQILPATPTFLINSFSGITSVSLWTFVWTTSLGIFPGSLVYTFAGQQIGSVESAKDLLSGPIILVLILLAVLSVVPLFLRRFFERRGIQ